MYVPFRPSWDSGILTGSKWWSSLFQWWFVVWFVHHWNECLIPVHWEVETANVVMNPVGQLHSTRSSWVVVAVARVQWASPRDVLTLKHCVMRDIFHGQGYTKRSGESSNLIVFTVQFISSFAACINYVYGICAFNIHLILWLLLLLLRCVGLSQMLLSWSQLRMLV